VAGARFADIDWPAVAALYEWLYALEPQPVVAEPVVAGVVLGLARGASTKVWQAADGTWMRRGTLLTLVLWIVSIAARVGIGFASHGATPLDTITFFLAVTFAAQNLAVWLRIGGARTHPVVEVR